jgi:hypothetical protein
MKVVLAVALVALLTVPPGCDAGDDHKSAVDEAQFVVDEFVTTGLQQPGEAEEN